MSDDPKTSGDGDNGDFSPPGKVTRDKTTSGFHDDPSFGRPGSVERDYFTKGAPKNRDQKDRN
jgi:hypothetical protein